MRIDDNGRCFLTLRELARMIVEAAEREPDTQETRDRKALTRVYLLRHYGVTPAKTRREVNGGHQNEN
jgi:hypothetical protein